MKLLLVVLFCGLVGIQAFPSQFIIDGQDAPDNIGYVRRIRSFRTPEALEALQYTGFFITPSRMLTVAQALFNFQHWEIEEDNGDLIVALRGVHHENFNSDSLLNNIGLLIFNTDTYLGDLAPLPTAETIVAPTFFVFGYGVTQMIEDGIQNLPTTLQRGLFSFVDLLTCRARFGLAVANDNVFCGTAAFPSDGNTRICSGDQGGPAVNSNNGELVGISSFWWDCLENTDPQGFTEISNYLTWIAGVL